MVTFVKYSATGNDFVVVDNRQGQLDVANKDFWRRVCDRHFGVGADGVLLLEGSTKASYRMRYLNADGGEVSMCGNGARALCHYFQTEITHKKEWVKFETAGSIYQGRVEADSSVSIVMSELYDENKIKIDDLYSQANYSFYANTGVPHCVYLVEDAAQIDLMKAAPQIRRDMRFSKGTNVNFYSLMAGKTLKVRTFERGVEAETLSCGTGIVATAVAELKRQDLEVGLFKIQAQGGELEVEITKDRIIYRGEVLRAFKGEILLKP